MTKKLMAVAVAGALAIPGMAFAQSSVTISGFFKMGLENIKLGSFSSARAPGGNNSEMRVADNSSRLIFNVTEDLGNGLQAVGQIDNRFAPDNGAIAATGNTWVGLRSASMGFLGIGRFDLHYGQNASDIVNKAGALKAASISLLDFVNVTTVAGTATTAAIANATRTPNAIKWQSPNWNGFDMIAAYSTNAGGTSENDLGGTAAAVTNRKGQAWNINPQFTASNWQVGYSYWDSKPDASLADQTGNNLFGWFKFGDFKIGASFNKSKLKNPVTGADLANRDAWSIPVSWTAGPHNFLAHYTVANKDKAQDSAGIGSTGAKMIAAAYVYDLSKRTSVGLTYAQIKNESNAAYALFTDGGNGVTGLSSTNAAPMAGEDPQLIALTMKASF
ncbi:MAG: porin [Burkholderiales bacterium]